jgi:hypothetical protein
MISRVWHCTSIILAKEAEAGGLRVWAKYSEYFKEKLLKANRSNFYFSLNFSLKVYTNSHYVK